MLFCNIKSKHCTDKERIVYNTSPRLNYCNLFCCCTCFWRLLYSMHKLTWQALSRELFKSIVTRSWESKPNYELGRSTKRQQIDSSASCL